VVDRLMAKDPAQRHQTAAEAAQELKRWAGGQPAAERPADLVFLEEVAKLETAELSEDVDILPPSDAVVAGEPPPLVPPVPPVALLAPQPSLWQNANFRLGLVMFVAGLVTGILLVVLFFLVKGLSRSPWAECCAYSDPDGRE